MADPSSIVAAALNGILFGGLYALMASGFNIIYGVMRIINLVHPEFVTLSAYTAFWLLIILGVDPLITLAIFFIPFFIIGMTVYNMVVRPLLKTKLRWAEKELLIAIATFGILVAIEGAVVYFWTADIRSIKTFYSAESMSFFGINTSSGRIIGFAIAIAIFLVVQFLFTRSNLGRAVRAVSENTEAAMLMGINIEKVNMFGFGLGTALAATAGPLLAFTIPLSPFMGLELLITLMAVVIVGGMGSPMGALFGGILIGASESLAVQFMPQVFGRMVPFIAIIIVLLIRPTGIMGRTSW
jgi:branched-chain amino acid transport system permease protein